MMTKLEFSTWNLRDADAALRMAADAERIAAAEAKRDLRECLDLTAVGTVAHSRPLVGGIVGSCAPSPAQLTPSCCSRCFTRGSFGRFTSAARKCVIALSLSPALRYVSPSWTSIVAELG